MSLTSDQVNEAIEGRTLNRIYDATAGKKWTLVFRDDATANARKLSFSFLGAGTNKIVFQVFENGNPTEWVLCFQQNDRQQTDIAKKDLEDEMKLLQWLGQSPQSCSVPSPWPVAAATAAAACTPFQFHCDNTESGFEYDPWAFIIQYLDTGNRYIEMKKKDGDLSAWLGKCFQQNSAGGKAKAGVARTRSTFDAIKAAYEKKPWGDFQVMYDKDTGALVVFDPMPGSPNADLVRKILTQWDADTKMLESS